MRAITEEQARAVLKILVEASCHRTLRDYDEYSFVYHVTRDCMEYRLNGSLGFGGKFRNNGNRSNTPHVDCYPEDETPERLARIEAVNKRLDALFNPSKPQERP